MRILIVTKRFAVVYSTKDDPQFMLECIRAGAADYVLRPLRSDVIKTLFLVFVLVVDASRLNDSRKSLSIDIGA